MRFPQPPVLLPVAFILLAAGYPLLRLLLVPAFPALAPAQMATGAGAGLSMTAICNSARIGVEVGIAALVPGFGFAYLLERHDGRGVRLLSGCLWLLLLMPSYLLSSGWQSLVSTPPFAAGPLYGLVFSEAGIVTLLMLKGLPFACFAARLAWAAAGGEIAAALRIHVRSRWRRAAILARLMAPAAGAVFAVMFIEGIADFGIAATLGAHLRLPLVIYGIYAALARTPIDFGRAASLSLVLIVLAAAAVLLHQWLHARGATANGRARPAPRLRPSRMGAAIGTIGTGLLVAVAFVAPGAALTVRAVASIGASHLSASEWASVLYAACYAFSGATVATMLAVFLIGSGVRRHQAATRAVDIIMLGSMAVPGIVLGAAYVVAFNGWLPLYGTPLLLLLGLVTTHLPMLTRFLQGPLQGAHADLADAASVHGLQRLRRIELVHAPLLLRPLLWGWSLAFAAIFFELPLSSLLYPIGRAPVGVQLLMLDETMRLGDEARLALAGIVACLGVVGLVAGLLPWWISRPARAPVGVSAIAG